MNRWLLVGLVVVGLLVGYILLDYFYLHLMFPDGYGASSSADTTAASASAGATQGSGRTLTFLKTGGAARMVQARNSGEQDCVTLEPGDTEVATAYNQLVSDLNLADNGIYYVCYNTTPGGLIDISHDEATFITEYNKSLTLKDNITVTRSLILSKNSSDDNLQAPLNSISGTFYSLYLVTGDHSWENGFAHSEDENIDQLKSAQENGLLLVGQEVVAVVGTKDSSSLQTFSTATTSSLPLQLVTTDLDLSY